MITVGIISTKNLPFFLGTVTPHNSKNHPCIPYDQIINSHPFQNDPLKRFSTTISPTIKQPYLYQLLIHSLYILPSTHPKSEKQQSTAHQLILITPVLKKNPSHFPILGMTWATRTRAKSHNTINAYLVLWMTQQKKFYGDGKFNSIQLIFVLSTSA